MFSSEKFVSGIVGVVVAVIVVGLVALPIINEVTSGMTADGDATLKTIIGIIPIFLVIGILMAVVAMFLKTRND